MENKTDYQIKYENAVNTINSDKFINLLEKRKLEMLEKYSAFKLINGEFISCFISDKIQNEYDFISDQIDHRIKKISMACGLN